MVLVIWHHKEEAVLLHKSYNQQGLSGKENKKKRYSGNTYNISILTHFRNGANLEIQKKN